MNRLRSFVDGINTEHPPDGWTQTANRSINHDYDYQLDPFISDQEFDHSRPPNLHPSIGVPPRISDSGDRMQTVSMPDFTAMTSEGRVRPEKRVPNQRRDYFDPIMNQSKREPNNAEFTVTDAEMDRRRQARNDTLYEDTAQQPEEDIQDDDSDVDERFLDPSGAHYHTGYSESPDRNISTPYMLAMPSQDIQEDHHITSREVRHHMSPEVEEDEEYMPDNPDYANNYQGFTYSGGAMMDDEDIDAECEDNTMRNAAKSLDMLDSRQEREIFELHKEFDDDAQSNFGIQSDISQPPMMQQFEARNGSNIRFQSNASKMPIVHEFEQDASSMGIQSDLSRPPRAPVVTFRNPTSDIDTVYGNSPMGMSDWDHGGYDNNILGASLDSKLMFSPSGMMPSNRIYFGGDEETKEEEEREIM